MLGRPDLAAVASGWPGTANKPWLTLERATTREDEEHTVTSNDNIHDPTTPDRCPRGRARGVAAATGKQHRYTYDGLQVPYVTLWSNETHHTPRLVIRRGRGGEGLGYANEREYDRDHAGVLWVQQAIAPGRGTPDLPAMHALRQRRAIIHMLCQACGESTLEPDGERQLFLLHAAGGVPVQEGERTAAPPVHPWCALEAIEQCPPLRNGGHVAAWVGHSPAWGVAGTFYNPATLHRISSKLVEVPYTSPNIRWVVAHRKVITLHECIPTTANELRDLVAERGTRAVGAPAIPPPPAP